MTHFTFLWPTPAQTFHCIEAIDAPAAALQRAHTKWESEMKTIVLMLSFVMLTTASHAAPRSLEKECRALVGKEEPEGTDGKSHMGQLNVQRFSDCLMGAPR